MARNGSGSMTIPNTLVAGTTITASDHNENYSDIATELTNSVAADGQTTMSGPLKGPNGTAAAPSHTFGSDTNTGAYRIGSDNYGIAAGGTKIVDVATTGISVTGTFSASGASTLTGAATFGAGGDLGTGTFTGAATLSGNLTLSGNNTYSGTASFSTTVTVPDASFTYAKLASAATASQAQMETGSATDAIVTPGRAHFHQFASKAWACVTVSGITPTLQAGFNIASVVRNDPGDYTITFTTAMSTARFAVGASALDPSASPRIISVKDKSTTTVRVGIHSTSAPADVSFDIIVFGDH